MNRNNTQHDNSTDRQEITRQDPGNWSEDNRRNIRQQISRTDTESQKVENIVNYFTAQKSEEHDVYAPDKTPGAAMEEKRELTFTFSPENLGNYFGTVDYGLGFLVTAIEEYTYFMKHNMERIENEHGEDVIRVEYQTDNKI